MSYHQAIKCFTENKALINPPTQDALQWNLANGLLNLVAAIQSDLSAIDTRLQSIERLLRDQARR